MKTKDRRRRNTNILIGSLLVVIVLLTLNRIFHPFYRFFEKHMDAVIDETQSVESIAVETTDQNKVDVKSQIDRLSHASKMAQLTAFDYIITEPRINNDFKDISEILKKQPGVLIISGEAVNKQIFLKLIKKIQSYSQNNKLIVPLIAVEHKGGSQQVLSGNGFTQLPAWSELCNYDSDTIDLLEISAQELVQSGVNIVFGPVLNQATSGSFVSGRACDNQEQGFEIANHYIEQFGKYQLMPVVENFPGVGQAKNNFKNEKEIISAQSFINQNEARNFRQIFDYFPNIGVLTSTVFVQEISKSQPCMLHSDCLQRFDDTYDNIIVFSDDVDSDVVLSSMTASQTQVLDSVSETVEALEAQDNKNLVEASVKAIETGHHFVTFSSNLTVDQYQQLITNLTDRYQEDEDFEYESKQRLKRILEIKNIN